MKDYFSLTGLNKDREHLVILLHDDILLETLKSTLCNCISTKELFDSLNARFPSESIPEAVLLRLRETKSMTSESAKQMRRLLEIIKNYACSAKESGYSSTFNTDQYISDMTKKLSEFLRQKPILS